MFSKYFDQIEKLKDNDTYDHVYNKVVNYNFDDSEDFVYNCIDDNDIDYFAFPNILSVKEWETNFHKQQKELVKL